MRKHDDADAPCVVRGLSRPRRADGDDAERSGGDGRSSPADRWKRALPAAADERAPCRRGDHEIAEPDHPAEQDRSNQERAGDGAVREHP